MRQDCAVSCQEVAAQEVLGWGFGFLSVWAVLEEASRSSGKGFLAFISSPYPSEDGKVSWNLRVWVPCASNITVHKTG